MGLRHPKELCTPLLYCLPSQYSEGVSGKCLRRKSVGCLRSTDYSSSFTITDPFSGFFSILLGYTNQKVPWHLLKRVIRLPDPTPTESFWRPSVRPPVSEYDRRTNGRTDLRLDATIGVCNVVRFYIISLNVWREPTLDSINSFYFSGRHLFPKKHTVGLGIFVIQYPRLDKNSRFIHPRIFHFSPNVFWITTRTQIFKVHKYNNK